MSRRTPLATGSLIDGRLRVERVLGTGGFSSVYLVQNVNVPEMRYALKVLELEGSTLQSQERFVQEARIVASLDSPHVAAIRDYGHLPDGRPYLLAEYVDAPNLATIVGQFGGLTDAAVVEITRGVLRALEAVHAAGLVHRDIKPDNILVDLWASPGRVARLTDFGIAKVLDSVASPIGTGVRTDDGMVVCTPAFAAPEVLVGRPTFASDLFSLGLTVAAMVMGEHLFETSSRKSIIRQYIRDEEFEFPTSLKSHPLFPVVRRSLRKRAEQRYGTAREMLAELEHVASGVPAYKPPGPRRQRATPGAVRAVRSSSLSSPLANVETLPLSALVDRDD